MKAEGPEASGAYGRSDNLTVESASYSGKTKPPARFTEATLLGAMENSGSFYGRATTKSCKNTWWRQVDLELLPQERISLRSFLTVL